MDHYAISGCSTGSALWQLLSQNCHKTAINIKYVFLSSVRIASQRNIRVPRGIRTHNCSVADMRDLILTETEHT